MATQPALNPIQAFQMSEMERKTKALKEGFAFIDEANVPTVPEGIFVRDFLPIFSGGSTEYKDDFLSMWYLIAGTPYQAVNIIGMSGDIVAQVPPVLDRNSLTPSIHGSNLSAVFEEAKQRSHMSPALAGRIISNELEHRATSSLAREPDPKLAEAWNKLFTHYGIVAAAKPGTAAGQQSNESDFEME